MPATIQQPQSIKERVQGVINLIRPAVQADGGDIELVDGIERNIREKVPEVTQVIPVA